MKSFEHYAVAFILVFSFVVNVEPVTVNPLAPMCPTNKVAPRRKRYENSNPRTFREFYSLLAHDSPSSLQEKPQEDAPDDCREIEDYDENDISSVTSQSLRRQGLRHHKVPGSPHHLLTHHHYHGVKPPTNPPNRPTRPPPAGYFGTNIYRPPEPQEPTNYVKPVNEAGQDPQMVYRPGLIVGAPLNHVIGLPQQMRPPRPAMNVTEPDRQPKYFKHAYVPLTIQSDSNTKYYRQRKFNGDSGIIGSFVDLFF